MLKEVIHSRATTHCVHFHNRSSTKLLLASQQALCFYLTSWQLNGDGGGRANVNDMPPRSTVTVPPKTLSFRGTFSSKQGESERDISCHDHMCNSQWEYVKESDWDDLQFAVRQTRMTHQELLCTGEELSSLFCISHTFNWSIRDFWALGLWNAHREWTFCIHSTLEGFI